MKFLIQKINGQIVHDFSFTLLESIRYNNWIHNNKDITYKFVNTFDVVEPDDIYPMPFKPYHKNYVPIGSVEFVTDFLMHFYNLQPKPLNVPKELYHYAGREIFNGNHLALEDSAGKFFVKSNDKIKGYYGIKDYNCREHHPYDIPVGEYQFSDVINIDSEWRAFVYERKLVGLQNYSGDFTKWPNNNTIKGMIGNYKSAPIAYTLDVGISDDRGTFVIECHDFFSCGLYGFADHKILPYMFYKWFYEYLQKQND
jgi:hypothetical protein